MKIEVKIETSDSLESTDAHGVTIWQRVEKLKKVIEGYKGSDLCMKLGNNYIRPPVMRTNAIMKNVELKACLALWQYIEGYDKVGYEINVENTAVKPQNRYVEDFYKLVIMNLLLFRAYTVDSEKEMTELKTQKLKTLTPKFVKRFEKEVADDYGIQTDAAVGYIAADGEFRMTKRLPKNMNLVFTQISEAIKIEKAYLEEREKERLARVAAEEEAERLRLEEEARQEELRRIEEAKREERERLQREKEEEERRIQELLEQKRREQEEEERERARLEAERQAKLEEQRRLEEEARKKREEEERVAAERERVFQNKLKMRSELGEAEGVDVEKLEEHEHEDEEKLEQQVYEEVTTEEIEQVKAEMEEAAGEEQSEFEDPRAIAARKKLEQQRQEKERFEAERAARLKADRAKFEAKPFEQIRWEYSHNPIRLLQRLIQYILVYWFHIIPEDTDNPDHKRLRAELAEKKRIKEEEAAERDKMEVYYRKYAGTFKYRFRRYLADRKFKKKKKLEAKSRPKPTYTPPKRTPEEQREIDLEMKRLYREYHVSLWQKLARAHKERKRMRNELRESVGQKKNDLEGQSKVKSRAQKVVDVILTVILVISMIICGYVLINAARGKAVNLFGKSILQVVTGSMEPSIHVGDYIITEKTDVSELKEGDIISFYSDQEDVKGKIVTHRIVSVNEDGSFVTKGDSRSDGSPNETLDTAPAQPDKVIGKYAGKSRFFIWLSSFGETRKLVMIVVILPLAVMAVFELRSVTRLGRKVREEKRQQAAESKQKLIREEIEREKRRLEREGVSEDEVKNGEPR